MIAATANRTDHKFGRVVEPAIRAGKTVENRAWPGLLTWVVALWRSAPRWNPDSGVRDFAVHDSDPLDCNLGLR